MAKTLGKSRKIKTLERYGSEVGVYDLSKPLKKNKEKITFVVIAKPRPISGKPVITVWHSDEHGAVQNNVPLFTFKGIEISDALREMGYNLA